MQIHDPCFTKRNKLTKTAIIIRQLFGTLRDDDRALYCADYTYRLEALMHQWFETVSGIRPEKHNPDRNYESRLLKEDY